MNVIDLSDTIVSDEAVIIPHFHFELLFHRR